MKNNVFIILFLLIFPPVTYGATALQLDGGPTPEQIALFLPDNGENFPDDMTATLRYKKTVDVTWTVGHDLFHIVDDTRYSFDDETDWGFAWTITGLDQGTSYDIEVTTTGVGGDVYTLTASTSSLPGRAGAVTKTITTGMTTTEIEALWDTAVPGDVILIENGTYDVEGLNFYRQGDPDNLIYIQGQSRDGVIMSDPTGEVLRLNYPSNLVIENLTLQGSLVDGGPNTDSIGIFYSGSSGGNITLRNLNVTGVDKGLYCSVSCDQFTLYENVFQGNNTWTQDLWDNDRLVAGPDGTPDMLQHGFWSDTALDIGGLGNVIFNNTIDGFGDTFKIHLAKTEGLHFYRNNITMAGDDCFEPDGHARNVTIYDNRCTNGMTMASADSIILGPVLQFRNIGINIVRQAWKLNGQSSGLFLYNNTMMKTVPPDNPYDFTPYLWWQALGAAGGMTRWGYQNNIVIGQKVDPDYIKLLQYSLYLSEPTDWTNNSWYPDGIVNFTNGTGGYFDDLNDAVTNLADTYSNVFVVAAHKMIDDVLSEVQPFETEIVLGDDYFTEIDIMYTPTLTPDGVNNNSGVVVTGITDGFSGVNPDRGAIISGREVPIYGATRDAPEVPKTLFGASVKGVSLQ